MGILNFKKVNCKNCYKCIRYCPVKSIKIFDHQAQIIGQDCILCGNCAVVCPQNAKQIATSVTCLKKLIQNGEKLIASVDSTMIANYPNHSFRAVRALLLQLGFSDARETAEGAFLVKSAYEQLVEENYQPVILSSFCPSVVKYIEKHQPELAKYLAPVLSPMQAHAELIKQKSPDAKVVLIGPCISQKQECGGKSPVDFVLTFDELEEWLAEENLHLQKEQEEAEKPKYSRLFPLDGGVVKTMTKKTGIHYLSVDGMSACIQALNEVKEGSLQNCFLALSACKDGCLGGPAFRKTGTTMLTARMAVERLAGDSPDDDFQISDSVPLKRHFRAERRETVMPTEQEITEILAMMGKKSLEDELNCGTCGYSTCREQAIAVYHGKAETSMCLPYMRTRAESLSDKIIAATPNAIIAVDTGLRVKQMNQAACRMFEIMSETDIIGQPVSGILEEADFEAVITSGESGETKQVFLEKYHRYLEQIFLFDKTNDLIICIMKDITDEKTKKNQLMKVKKRAADMADEIVKRQLSIVHEIASLLGETAAETKSAVHEMKQTILMEEEEE